MSRTVITTWSMRSMFIADSGVPDRTLPLRIVYGRGAARVAGQCARGGGLRMEPGRVVHRHGGIARADQHRDLGAAEHDALRAACDEMRDDRTITRTRIVAHDASAELVVDDAMDA